MFPQSTKSTHFKLQKKHVVFTYPFNYTIKTSLKKQDSCQPKEKLQCLLPYLTLNPFNIFCAAI